MVSCLSRILGTITAFLTAGAAAGVFASAAYLVEEEQLQFKDRHVFILCIFLGGLFALLFLVMLIGSCVSFKIPRIANVTLEITWAAFWCVVVIFLPGRQPFSHQLLAKVWKKDDYRPAMILIEKKIECCGWKGHRNDCAIPSARNCDEVLADLMETPVKVLTGMLLLLIAFITVAAVVQIFDVRANMAEMRVSNATEVFAEKQTESVADALVAPSRR
jgi:hypothetical protein